jgi:site-specific recombinase XerD
MGTSKEPIRLRKRVMATGNVSLYLDIYINGKRSYEYLHLYLIPEKTRADKEKNRETMKFADAIRAKRVVELQNGRFGFCGIHSSNANVIDYFSMLRDKRRASNEEGGNWRSWDVTLKYLKQYCKSNTMLKDINRQWVQGFRDYLDKLPLKESSKQIYFSKLRACVNQAYNNQLIAHNPLRSVENFKGKEHERSYLTLDEVKAMAATEFSYNPVIKRAFLFSCLTGLRKSDIMKMTWAEVRQQGEFTRIVFCQKKTGGQEYIDINQQAVEYMGERGEPTAKVFAGFNYTPYSQMKLKAWAAAAGIKKDVTFHTARHTFAVLMLDLGADIYTVQKLLGHRELHTTQIYAKVLDKNKQAAVNLIPKIK